MNAFFRSHLYADFWKFILLGGPVVGFLSSFGFTASQILRQDWDNLSFLSTLIAFLVGCIYGLLAATLGFWIVFGVAQTKIVLPFPTKVGLTRGPFGVAVLIAFFWNATMENFSFTLALFPGVPFLGSLYFFWKFSERFIKPHLT